MRFAEVLAVRTDSFIRGVQEIKTRDEMIEFCSRMIDGLLGAGGPVARSQRVNALGATYKRPDFAKRMAQAQEESCEALASALKVPHLRGLIDESLDLHAFAHWVHGLLLSRALIELDGDEDLGKKWNELTKRTILATLFGPDAAASRL